MGKEEVTSVKLNTDIVTSEGYICFCKDYISLVGILCGLS